MDCECKKEPVMVQLTDETTVTITKDEYKELVDKAIRLDVIADSIRQRVDQKHYSKVDEDIVLMMTGMLNYQRPTQPEEPEAKDE